MELFVFFNKLLYIMTLDFVVSGNLHCIITRPKICKKLLKKKSRESYPLRSQAFYKIISLSQKKKKKKKKKKKDFWAALKMSINKLHFSISFVFCFKDTLPTLECSKSL
jgi:hypothetical protein